MMIWLYYRGEFLEEEKKIKTYLFLSLPFFLLTILIVVNVIVFSFSVF